MFLYLVPAWSSIALEFECKCKAESETAQYPKPEQAVRRLGQPQNNCKPCALIFLVSSTL